MLKIANQIIDAYDDISREGLAKLASAGPNINLMSAAEWATLKDDDFALSMITKMAAKLNKFPIDSMDNTWLSNEYFELNHDKLPKTAAETAAFNIKTACERFGVTPKPSVLGMAKEASSNVYFESSTERLVKTAQVEEVSLEKIASVRDVAENPTHAQYAMPTPSHVKVAGQYFAEKLEKIPLDLRHKYAAAVQLRAKELGMPVQAGMIGKYASDHYSGMVDAHLKSRETLVGANPEDVQYLQKLAGAKKELSPSQFAQALHGFDKKAGLVRHYGSYLVNPYEATFAKEPDQYEGYRMKVGSVNMDGAGLRILANEKYAQIKNYFGASLADEFKRDPVAIFESLPLDAKQIIGGIADGTA
jgi:hypothetical protein